MRTQWRAAASVERPSPLATPCRRRAVAAVTLAPQILWNAAPGSALGMSSTSVVGSEAGEFTEVVVVRHGETSWNASRMIQGQLDVELNETAGRQQAVAKQASNHA
ncbi:hypothetical protein ABZP36_026156 [Zizania latifolia]